MEKVPSCLENVSLVWRSLNEAQSNNSNVKSIGLHIANAYDSIPHRLTFFALERYGVQEH